MGSAHAQAGTATARTSIVMTRRPIMRRVPPGMNGFARHGSACDGNSGYRALVPGHRPDRVVSETCLHDEGVFPRVEIVAAPATDDLESEAAIERDGGGIARTHLEEGQGHTPGHALREGGGQDGAAHAAMAPLQMHGEVGDVDLVTDLPEAEISDHLTSRAHHRAA